MRHNDPWGPYVTLRDVINWFYAEVHPSRVSKAAGMLNRARMLLKDVEWQPLETAPLHQSVILYATYSYQGDQPFRGEAYKDWDAEDSWRWSNGNLVRPEWTPRAWMPLPEPPR